MNANPRPVYTGAQLAALIRPRSIAVVGASPNGASFAGRTLAQLGRFEGPVWPVNPNHAAIDGEKCYPDIASLPKVPDCVVVAVGQASTLQIVAQCAQAGVGAVILYASGYAETGRPERVGEQARIAALASASGMRVLGPNCVGLINVALRAPITFSATPEFPPLQRPAIGLVSQSGALGISLAQAVAHGISLSHILASGNSCDVDVADLVSGLADDPACDVIACVFEGMADPCRLLEAAARARDAGKPLLVFKLGTGEQGAAAALSHTGSLAGSLATYKAALERSGAVWVERFEDLLPMAAFFGKAQDPVAAGVAVLATSGGAAIMAADTGERYRVPLPQPSPGVQALLARCIPDFGSARNPCDVTAQMLNDIESLWACAAALIDDPAYGVLLHPAPLATPLLAERISRLSTIARRAGKPVCIVWLTQWLEGPGCAEANRDPHVALFHSMDACFAALAAWHLRSRSMRIPGVSVRTEPSVLSDTRQKLQDIADTVVPERIAKALLAPYGLPVIEERLAVDAGQALAIARDFWSRSRTPLAMKIESVDIAHKTEAGGVVLGIGTPEEVAASYSKIVAAAHAFDPAARIAGVLIQPMVAAGLELVIGARRDAQFGPVVLVGIGGVLVELIGDSAVAVAPVSQEEALEMIGRLRAGALLDGFRGAPPVDRLQVARMIEAVSRFISDHPQVQELDLNPVTCNADGVWVVDALIRLDDSSA